VGRLSSAGSKHVRLLGLALACLAVAIDARASDDTASPTAATTPSPPEGFTSPELEALWREAIRLERHDLYLAAARLYERMAAESPRVAYPYWKVSRSHWRHAESLPADPRAERLPWFEGPTPERPAA
jgi:hypothetical protein